METLKLTREQREALPVGRYTLEMIAGLLAWPFATMRDRSRAGRAMQREDGIIFGGKGIRVHRQRSRRIYEVLLSPEEEARQRRANSGWPADWSARDEFAARALTGIVDRVLFSQTFERNFLKSVGTKGQKAREKKAAELNRFCAFLAYDMADAMMQERDIPF